MAGLLNIQHLAWESQWFSCYDFSSLRLHGLKGLETVIYTIMNATNFLSSATKNSQTVTSLKDFQNWEYFSYSSSFFLVLNKVQKWLYSCHAGVFSFLHWISRIYVEISKHINVPAFKLTFLSKIFFLNGFTNFNGNNSSKLKLFQVKLHKKFCLQLLMFDHDFSSF